MIVWWFFKIVENMWPVYSANEDLKLAESTISCIPGGHVFGPYQSYEAAARAADSIMAADEAALGGNL